MLNLYFFVFKHWRLEEREGIQTVIILTKMMTISTLKTMVRDVASLTVYLQLFVSTRSWAVFFVELSMYRMDYFKEKFRRVAIKSLLSDWERQ